MKRSLQVPFGALVLTLVSTLVPSSATAATAADPFLTGPAEGTALKIALGYMDANKAKLGLTAGDLSDLVVSDQYRTRHNGVTHVYLQQRLGGVEVVNGLFNVNVMSDGRILGYGNRFVGNLAGTANAVAPRLEPEEAVARTAEHLGLDLPEGELFVLEVLGGPALEVRFNDAGVSRHDITAGLKYLPLEAGAVRLVWNVAVQPIAGSDWWNVFVDAETGVVLDKHNFTANEVGRAFELSADRSELASRGAAPLAPDSYQVYAIPNESPDDAPRSVEANPADALASPFGWHDTDGAPGAESTLTVGNNVQAQTDVNANNNPGPPDIQPDGGPSLDFLFPLNLNNQPSTYQAAAVTNLFYWNNIMHDVTYQYGFDPASGNFQQNTYGGGGVGGDAVKADAQDGSGTDNANFLTLPDGNPNSRMQMYIWTNPFGQLVTVNSPGNIAGDYVANPSNNGGTAMGFTGDLVLVVDGTPPTTDACQTVTNNLTGKIAVIVWNEGECNSSVFVQNAATAGASAAIIIDNQDIPYTNFGGSASIPSVAVGLSDGNLFLANLPVNATMDDNPAGMINRDSDLDNGVIAHEYGHGISNRLTGGPANVGCLNHNEQAGEGWSDWWALSLFPLSSDTRTTTRGIGNYVSFRPVTDAGIRNFPYSTDLAVNPQTYMDIGATNIPHGVGEIWAAMLWEVYWNLVDKHGFDADLYTGTGGNNLAIQLVVDGMKMQPCSPTFVQARDAILAADVANNGGANEDEIWCGFAKRGVGFSASAGGTGVGDEVEAFDLPPGVVCAQIFSDGFESGDTSAWSVIVP